MRHFRTLGPYTHDGEQLAEAASRELQALESKYSTDPGVAVLVWDARSPAQLYMHVIALRQMGWNSPDAGLKQPRSIAMTMPPATRSEGSSRASSQHESHDALTEYVT